MTEVYVGFGKGLDFPGVLGAVVGLINVFGFLTVSS